jgi:hypothetical protein
MLQFTIHNLIHNSQCTIHNLMNNYQFTFHNAQFIIQCTIHNLIHNAHFNAQFTFQFTIHNSQFTIIILQCTMLNYQFTFTYEILVIFLELFLGIIFFAMYIYILFKNIIYIFYAVLSHIHKVNISY